MFAVVGDTAGSVGCCGHAVADPGGADRGCYADAVVASAAAFHVDSGTVNAAAAVDHVGAARAGAVALRTLPEVVRTFAGAPGALLAAAGAAHNGGGAYREAAGARLLAVGVGGDASGAPGAAAHGHL